MKLIVISIGIILISACTSTSDNCTETSGKDSDKIEVTGQYGYGPGADKGRTGTMTVFPNDNKTLLFGIDLSVGPPSYNMGALFDTLTVDESGHLAIFENDKGYGDKGCKWEVMFHGDSLTIKTLNGANECGFGNGVYADGTYRLIDRNLPDAYTDQVGDTIYQTKRQ
ncbi:hypothetical protein H8S90_13410 [Olivibacter sp. SDN3]|uniref:hypothetical protein n=1 Tax=Olivibacter sp. SDN3 TaxID=2764720 RepID=UPI001650ED2C|nr:hypothetical protein [Olivibacter sp. SDN3]QNL47818.1 hypothetical protein H8S90_13410 [Olivibacter sp. SDN3]